MQPEERLLFWQSKFPLPPSLKQRLSTGDEAGDSEDEEGSYTLNDVYSSLDRRHARDRSRAVSTRRVCWHRNTSISMQEYTLSLQVSY